MDEGLELGLIGLRDGLDEGLLLGWLDGFDEGFEGGFDDGLVLEIVRCLRIDIIDNDVYLTN